MILDYFYALKGYQYAFFNIINENLDSNHCIRINVRLDERSINRLKLIDGKYTDYINVFIHGDTMYKVIEQYTKELKTFEHGLDSCLIPMGLALKIIKEYAPNDAKLVASIYNSEHDKIVIKEHIKAHQKYINELEHVYEEYTTNNKGENQ